MWAYMTGAPGASGFGSATTAEQVAAGHDLHGKVALVTGASSGIGHEAARVLALQGATVYVHARSLDKANAAIATLKTGATSGATFKPFVCDLGNLKTIRDGVATFLAEDVPLHLLINNAGIMMPPLQYTADGFESQFGTNHVGHQLLTLLLLDKLKASAPARVVMLSSSAHKRAPRQGILFDDLDARKSYDPMTRYGHSKLANVLFARAMHARQVPGVIFYSCHPGVIMTNLSRYMVPESVSRWVKHMPFGKSIPQGAATTVFCAVSDKAVPGEYHADCNVMESPHPHFRDLAMAARLVEVTDALIAEAAKR